MELGLQRGLIGLILTIRHDPAYPKAPRRMALECSTVMQDVHQQSYESEGSMEMHRTRTANP